MGLLIIAGFLFVGYVSYQRMTGSGTFGKPPSQAAIQGSLADLEALAGGVAPGGSLAVPTVTALGLPDDARVEEIDEVGNHALVLIRQPGAGDRLYLIDPRTGALTAAIALGTVPPPVPLAAAPPAKAAGSDR
jgi:hypothetical protein